MFLCWQTCERLVGMASRAPQSYYLYYLRKRKLPLFTETFPENSRLKSQINVFVTKKVFLQQKPVTERSFCDIRRKKFPSFVAYHMKKFTLFHGTFTEENYFVEPCLDMMYTWEINKAATHV